MRQSHSPGRSSELPQWPVGAQYALALALVGGALLMRLFANPLLEESATFVFFLLAIVATAWLAGLRPALLALAVGLLLSWFAFMPPQSSFTLPTMGAGIQLAVSLIAGLTIAVIVGRLHTMRAEQATARQVLAESEIRYRSLFNSIDEGFAIIEMIFDEEKQPVDYRFLEVNPAYEKHTGLHDAAGRTVREMVPDLEEHWFQTYGQVALTGKPARFVNNAKPMGDRWFDVYAFRIGEPHQHKVALLFRNITEQQHREEAIRFQARLLDTVGQSVIVTDPNYIVIYWNRAAEQLFGWKRDEAVGQNIITMTTPPENIEEAERIMDRLRRGESWTGEFTVQCKDDTKPVLVTNTPLFDEEGTLKAIIGISVDITPQKMAQESLQEADRRKDEFLATLAHELRNPLAAIGMAVNVLSRETAEDHALSHRQLDSMTAILNRQTHQLERLIDDLLDVSRITRGKIRLQKQPVELAPLIMQAMDSTQPRCAEKQIDLTATVPPQPIMVQADPNRLVQVIGNLLHNACKFTGRGGRVRVRLEEENGQAVIRVQDTGRGIPPEQLSRIFDMFAQVEDARHGGHGGLGIGLSLARMLMDLHGGTIEAHSEGPDKGSEFIVRVPLLVKNTSSQPPAESKGETTAPTTCRVLIVDDHPDALETVSTMLQVTGHDVATAPTGEAALKLAEQVKPDVMLIDIGLPDINGHEVARRIRRQPWGNDVKLIAITGWGQEKDKHEALEAGFDVHLTKPADPKVLERHLTPRTHATSEVS